MISWPTASTSCDPKFHPGARREAGRGDQIGEMALKFS